MILASESRQRARQSLAGNWKKSALITLVFLLVSFALGLLEAIPVIGAIAVLLLSTPLSYGLLTTFIKIKRNEPVTYTSFLKDGLSSFKQIWFVTLQVILKLLPWILLLILSIVLISSAMAIALFNMEFSSLLSLLGIVLYIGSLIILFTKSLYYSLANYVLFDNPELSAKEIVEKSKTLMTGNRARFFCLSLSFIGWIILSAFTFGIGYLFLLPYMQVSITHFYEDLIEQK